MALRRPGPGSGGDGIRWSPCSGLATVATSAVEAFDSIEDAARAYAYLVGYLIEEVATARHTSEATVIADLRAGLLRWLGGAALASPGAVTWPLWAMAVTGRRGRR